MKAPTAHAMGRTAPAEPDDVDAATGAGTVPKANAVVGWAAQTVKAKAPAARMFVVFKEMSPKVIQTRIFGKCYPIGWQIKPAAAIFLSIG